MLHHNMRLNAVQFCQAMEVNPWLINNWFHDKQDTDPLTPPEFQTFWSHQVVVYDFKCVLKVVNLNYFPAYN